MKKLELGFKEFPPNNLKPKAHPDPKRLPRPKCECGERRRKGGKCFACGKKLLRLQDFMLVKS